MSKHATIRFRLYVADDTANSVLAIANLNALCRDHLPGRHSIEIVDLFKHPHRALEDSVLMTPTLMILAPPPLRTIVGTLSQTQTLLQLLGLDKGQPAAA